MANISQTFQTQDVALANYNYAEIADGLGYVTFYAFTCTNVTPTTTYHLAQNPVTSDPQGLAHGNTTNTYDMDFDTSAFTAHRTIKGDVLIAFSIASVAAPGSGSGQVIATLYHYDGTTETSLGAQTSTVVSTGSSKTHQLRIAVAETRFKKGDILRLNVQFVCVSGGGGNYRTTLGHDPLNRDYIDIVAATYPSYFKVAVPFRIDL